MLMVVLARTALALTPQDLCLTAAQPTPPSPTLREEVDPSSPLGALVPHGWEDLDEVPRKGRFLDPAGNSYSFDDIEDAVLGAEPDSHRATPQDYYKGEYAIAWVQTASGLPIPYQYPTDRAAWRRAGAQAREVNRAHADDDPGSRRARFAVALCTYNHAAERAQEARLEAEGRLSAAQSARELAGADVPMAAFAATNRVYNALGKDPPDDLDQRAADARAVWAATQRLGSLDAVIDEVLASHAATPDAPVTTLLETPAD